MRHVCQVVAVLAVAAVAGFYLPVTRWRHTCLVCRQLRVRTEYLAIPRTRQLDTDCSRWYASHVEATHEHVWERSVCTYTSNLYGMPRGVGCSPGRFPIWSLDPKTQLAVYQRFDRPIEAKAVFAELADAKSGSERLEGDIFSKGQHLVNALEAWEAAGFPGAWPEWWAAYYNRHLVEHREYVRWLHSNSGMNFWAWQKQRQSSGEVRPDARP